MGGGRLRKVVAHGRSTVRPLPCWASAMRREHPYITAHFLSFRPINRTKADRNFFDCTSTVCKNQLSRQHFGAYSCMIMSLKQKKLNQTRDKTRGSAEQRFVRVGSAARSNCLPLNIPVLTERYLFRIPSIEKYEPFHIPCLELCIPSNCCKCTVFEI